ncbi:oxidoreductase [Microbacterium sp. CH12i]|uniref:FAD-dependent oxidoreductase n=1 Tax=Microbacterium sp. CH12i TaxID=1479651 RepID=UPI00046101E9|nr:FAD-dependent oxidoreductase [Microbacterium sp. CH12i]KDA06489.1 oxidoreductase [Microbacterium sp. CH12i]
MRESGDSAEPDAVGAQIAVIGSGPSGCYTAQFLTKADPSVRVTVFDRLPAPFGLVRYGVAADHQGTKAVIRQFERLFDLPRVRFAGNVELGRELSIDDLLESFDAVILATGLHDDRLLETDGSALPGVVGSGVLTRFLNGHPDEDGETLACGSDVVVVGAGNVAVDVVRLLAKTAEHYEGSDMDDEAHSRLTAGVRSITLVARSSAEAAKFDRAMVRELGDIAGVAIEVHGVDTDASDPKSETVRALVTTDAPSARVRISLRFHTTPGEIVGTEHVEGLRVSDASGQHVIPAQTIVTAIGFRGETLAVSDPRVHTVGWARRGPVGTIPDNRTDARQVADEVLAGLATRDPALPGFDGLPQTVRDRAVAIDHWRQLDAVELASADAGRIRRKIRTWAGLLDQHTVSHDTKGTDQ